jgi:hypothetical protein
MAGGAAGPLDLPDAGTGKAVVYGAINALVGLPALVAFAALVFQVGTAVAGCWVGGSECARVGVQPCATSTSVQLRVDSHQEAAGADARSHHVCRKVHWKWVVTFGGKLIRLWRQVDKIWPLGTDA